MAASGENMCDFIIIAESFLPRPSASHPCRARQRPTGEASRHPSCPGICPMETLQSFALRMVHSKDGPKVRLFATMVVLGLHLTTRYVAWFVWDSWRKPLVAMTHRGQTEASHGPKSSPPSHQCNDLKLFRTHGDHILTHTSTLLITCSHVVAFLYIVIGS